MTHRSPPLLLTLVSGAVITGTIGFSTPAFVALLIGVIVASLGWRPAWASDVAKWALVATVFLIGSRLDLEATRHIGWGFIATTGAVVLTLLLLARSGVLGAISSRPCALLVGAGTAICGGSAIAVLAPIVRARAVDLGVAMGVVFACNALALAAMPFLGEALKLEPELYGLWCAMSIHETSSVVSAASEFGPEAANVATLGKLVRTLWILPVALLLTALYGDAKKGVGVRRTLRSPVLLAFAGTGLIAWLFPQVGARIGELAFLSKYGIRAVMVFTGLTVGWSDLREAGLRAFLAGLALWVGVAATTLVILVGTR